MSSFGLSTLRPFWCAALSGLAERSKLVATLLVEFECFNRKREIFNRKSLKPHTSTTTAIGVTTTGFSSGLN